MLKNMNSMGIVALASMCAAAGAQDLHIISAAAVKTSMMSAPAMFAKESGKTFSIDYGTAGRVRDMAMKGMPFDVVILPPKSMTELIEVGLIESSSQKPLGVVKPIHPS